MAQFARWLFECLLLGAWALAIGSIPGMAIGLIPWGLFWGFWGAALGATALDELVLNRPRPPPPKPKFRNYSPRSKYPSDPVQPLPLP